MIGLRDCLWCRSSEYEDPPLSRLLAKLIPRSVGGRKRRHQGMGEASRQFRRSLSAKRYRHARDEGRHWKPTYTNHGFAMSLFRATGNVTRGRVGRFIAFRVASSAKNVRLASRARASKRSNIDSWMAMSGNALTSEARFLRCSKRKIRATNPEIRQNVI